jgi:hypothetical protein
LLGNTTFLRLGAAAMDALQLVFGIIVVVLMLGLGAAMSPKDFKAALRFGRKIPMEQSKPWQYIFAFCWVFLLCQRSLSWTMKNIHHSVVEFLFGQSTNR